MINNDFICGIKNAFSSISMEAKIMWLIKFTFIVFGVIYELLHYVVTNTYNTINKRLSNYFYPVRKPRHFETGD